MRRVLFGWVTVAVALLIAGCGGAAHPVTSPSGSHFLSARTPLTWSSPMPARYEGPFDVTGDSSDAGVWYLGEYRHVWIYHWVPDKSPQRWEVAVQPKDCSLCIGVDSALAIDASGNAWIGINHTLIRFSPQTDSEASWTVPIVQSAALSGQSQSIANYHAVDSIAIHGNLVAVASVGSRSIAVLDSTTGTFSSIILPDHGYPTSIAYDQNGVLGVVESGTRTAAEGFMTVLPDGTQSEFHAETVGSVTTEASGNFLLGPHVSEFTPSSGTLTPRRVPSNLVLGTPVLSLSNGDIAAPIRGGAVVVNAQGDVVEEMPIGVSCQGISIPYVPGASHTPFPSDCELPATAQELTVDGMGNVYATASAGHVGQVAVLTRPGTSAT